MRKHLLLIAVLVGMASFSRGQDATFEWAVTYGSTGSDNSQGIVTDKAGNVYNAGLFSATADFDPGTGTQNLIPLGQRDVYVTKLTTNGDLLWVKQFEFTVGGNFYDIEIDQNANVYVIGSFTGTATFDGGSSLTNSNTKLDVFICKMDSSGSVQWAKQIESNGGASARDIKVDKAGNIFINGLFFGDTDLDPDPVNTFDIALNGIRDVYIVKLDSFGNFNWGLQFGEVSYTSNYSIELDSLSNLYLNLLYIDSIDCDPGAGQHFLTGNTALVKLDSAGTFIWAKNLEPSASNSAVSDFYLSVTEGGTIYLSGNFRGTVDFDPGVNTFDLVAQASYNLFAAKYDKDGNFKWAVNAGGPGNSIPIANCLDQEENLYTVGKFNQTVDFDPSSGVANLTVKDLYDGFAQKLDSAGNFIWAKHIMASNLYAEGRNCTIDNNGDFYIAGGYQDTTTINIDTNNVYYVYCEGSNDAIVIKLNQCPATSNSITATFCGSYTLNSQTYTVPGTYEQILANAKGCDSVISLTLTREISIGVSLAGNTITANADSVSYQWINCADNTPVDGATDKTFTPSETGSYAVVLSNGSCTDTSACTEVTVSGVWNTIQKDIRIYPNPSAGMVNVEMSEYPQQYSLMIVNSVGQTILTQKNWTESIQLNLKSGVYYVKLQNHEGSITKQFIVTP